MEGLIPYIYRAVLRHKGQQLFRSLSDSSGKFSRDQRCYQRLPGESGRFNGQELKLPADYNPATNGSLHRRTASCFPSVETEPTSVKQAVVSCDPSDLRRHHHSKNI
eukprot:Gb_38690 [translate_table: standard]